MAADAALAAVAEKSDPRRIADDAFFEVPATLRVTLADLVGGDPAEIVLGNSTSYGLNLLAQGLPLRPGDEVLVVEGDFPASVYPWLPLRRSGIGVRAVPARDGALAPDDLRSELTARTRVVCTSWVFSFTGRTADVPALVDVCREHGDITFVLNGSQAVGARPTAVAQLGVDVLVSCGFKWLCGPYATGFAWMRPEVMQRLDYHQGYWLAQVEEISRPPDRYALRADRSGAAYDVFGTANLSTYPAWERAVSLLLDHGLERVEALARLDAAGVDVAERAERVRVSPHVHNTPADIDRLVTALAG